MFSMCVHVPRVKQIHYKHASESACSKTGTNNLTDKNEYKNIKKN